MTPAKAGSAPLPWGVYVHFPWCLKKCPYCDFLSIPVDAERLVRLTPRAKETKSAGPLDATAARSLLPHAAYASAVVRELEVRGDVLDLESPPSSLFFGGGTPSLWEPKELGRVITALSNGWATNPQEDLEVTVECNPTSFDENHARRLLDVGVNRVSLGVQSLDAQRLEFLGRLHDAPGALHAIAAALRAGTPRVSADVIFGVAGQKPEDAAAEVGRLAETGITHLSAYALTIETNTHFGTLAQRGKLPLLDEALVAESFVAVEETLQKAGFEHYEVSNYSREGHRARHNVGYWRGHDYLGLGVGAWGTVRLPGGDRLRYRNTPSVERYIDTWTQRPPRNPFGSGPELAQREPISAATALSERIMLGLRLAEGLDLEEAAAELGVEPWGPERARARDQLLKLGRLEQEQGRLWIPQRHWLFADGIIAELL